MSRFTHLSLFSGIGGLDLAAEAAGFQTVGQCEWADYPSKVLENHWPDVPRWRDIRTLTKENFYEKTGLRTVDIISGGFPCQPFSVAGKRRGKADDRYLWPEMLRVIQELRPTWVIGENVAGIINMALDTVLSDLESIGYACRTFVVPACAVDAPHRRDRICIVAYAGSARLQGIQQRRAFDARGETESHGSTRKCGQTVAYSYFDGRGADGYLSKEGRDSDAECSVVTEGKDVPDAKSIERERHERFAEPAGCRGFAIDGWWPVEPDVGRVAHGVPSRVDRIRGLGNAVVPKQFYPFFRGIWLYEMGMIA